jgi:hypothetical protein
MANKLRCVSLLDYGEKTNGEKKKEKDFETFCSKINIKCKIIMCKFIL